MTNNFSSFANLISTFTRLIMAIKPYFKLVVSNGHSNVIYEPGIVFAGYLAGPRSNLQRVLTREQHL